MSDDLAARLRRTLSDAADGFETAAPTADMRAEISATVRRRQRLHGAAVVVAALALLAGGLTTFAVRSGGSSVATLAATSHGSGPGSAAATTEPIRPDGLTSSAAGRTSARIPPPDRAHHRGTRHLTPRTAGQRSGLRARPRRIVRRYDVHAAVRRYDVHPAVRHDGVHPAVRHDGVRARAVPTGRTDAAVPPAVPRCLVERAVSAVSAPAGLGCAEHHVLRHAARRIGADRPVLSAHTGGPVLRSDGCDHRRVLPGAGSGDDRTSDLLPAHWRVAHGGLLPAHWRAANTGVLLAPPGRARGDRCVLRPGGGLLRPGERVPCNRLLRKHRNDWRDLHRRLLRRAVAPERRGRVGREHPHPLLPSRGTLPPAPAPSSVRHGDVLWNDARCRNGRRRAAVLPEGRDVRPPAVHGRGGDLPAVHALEADALPRGLTTRCISCRNT